MTKKFATRRQLQERYGDKSHMFIEDLLKKDPAFPRPIKPGSGDSAHRLWDLDEIEAWERTKVSGPRAARKIKTADGGEVSLDEIASFKGGGGANIVVELKSGERVELAAKTWDQMMAG